MSSLIFQRSSSMQVAASSALSWPPTDGQTSTLAFCSKKKKTLTPRTKKYYFIFHINDNIQSLNLISYYRNSK